MVKLPLDRSDDNGGGPEYEWRVDRDDGRAVSPAPDPIDEGVWLDGLLVEKVSLIVEHADPGALSAAPRKIDTDVVDGHVRTLAGYMEDHAVLLVGRSDRGWRTFAPRRSVPVRVVRSSFFRRATE